MTVCKYQVPGRKGGAGKYPERGQEVTLSQLAPGQGLRERQAGRHARVEGRDEEKGATV